MRSKLLGAAFATALVAAVGLAGPAQAGTGDPHDKVWVCHSTASESNPWILIHIKRSGWERGHMGEDAHPGHLAEDQLFDDNPDKDAYPHGPAGGELYCNGGPNT